ncbi:MAG: thiol-disulfide isomerase/thioredoxin [Candidatus Paceibacteria bacterium]
MATQSPQVVDSSKEDLNEYRAAWAASRVLVLEEGASWSGNELNCSYFNTGDGQFVNVSAITGAEFIDDARSMVPVDWDNDGDLDMILKNRTAPRVRMLRNDYNSNAHFISLDLVGTVGHPDAIGSQVLVEAGGKTYMRRVYCGDGFLAQAPRRLHFGLGQAESIDRLTVNWADGSSEVFEQPAMDSLMRIVQGTGKLEEVPLRKGHKFRRAPIKTVTASERLIARVPLAEKIPLSLFPLPSFENPERVVGDLAGKPILVNLWASWCGGCRVELKDLETHAEQIALTGLQIVPMTTDDADSYPAAAKILEGHGLGALSGFVTEEQMKAFQLLFIAVFGKPDTVPLPTSLLFDQRGQLAALYLGPVDVEVLLQDLGRLAEMNPELAADTGIYGGGRWAFAFARDYRTLAYGFRVLGLQELDDFFLALARSRE